MNFLLKNVYKCGIVISQAYANILKLRRNVMFCPKCGTNLPEETTVCPSCGNQMQAQEQPPVMQLSAKARGLKKKEFLAKEASQSVKNAAKFSLISFAVAVVLVFVSVIVASNTAFYDLPLVTLVMDDSELEQMEDDLKVDSDLFDEARETLDEIEEVIDRSDYKAIDKFIDLIEDVAEKPTLSNFTAAVKQAEEVADIDLDEEVEAKFDFDSLDSMEEALEILNTVKIIAYVFAIIVSLIALLAFFRKSIGLVIFDAILAAPFVLAFAGFIWYALILAAFIAMIVFFSQINKAYKNA